MSKKRRSRDINRIYESRAKKFLILALFLIGVVGYWWFFEFDRPPQFFPLNNRNESYEITRDIDGIYDVNYSGKSDYGINSVTIARSPTDLDTFVGKNVFLSGRFKRSTTQCIVDVCKNIGGPYIGLYIHSIRENSNNFVNQRPRDKIIIYFAQDGDRVESIAQRFNISADTIRWENHLESGALAKGQKLRILPVTGVSHIVAKGDTLESLAKKYKTTKQKIIDYPFNEYADPENFILILGTTIIIPDGIKPSN